MHRQKQQLGVREKFLQLARGIESVQQRHGDIQQDEVGFEAFRSFEERAAVLHAADHLAAIFEQFSQPRKQNGVVVGHQDAWFLLRNR